MQQISIPRPRPKDHQQLQLFTEVRVHDESNDCWVEGYLPWDLVARYRTVSSLAV